MELGKNVHIYTKYICYWVCDVCQCECMVKELFSVTQSSDLCTEFTYGKLKIRSCLDYLHIINYY